jgi:hypothetical protein
MHQVVHPGHHQYHHQQFDFASSLHHHHTHHQAHQVHHIGSVVDPYLQQHQHLSQQQLSQHQQPMNGYLSGQQQHQSLQPDSYSQPTNSDLRYLHSGSPTDPRTLNGVASSTSGVMTASDYMYGGGTGHLGNVGTATLSHRVQQQQSSSSSSTSSVGGGQLTQLRNCSPVEDMKPDQHVQPWNDRTTNGGNGRLQHQTSGNVGLTNMECSDDCDQVNIMHPSRHVLTAAFIPRIK